MPKKSTIYQAKYDAAHTRRFAVKLNTTHDADIIAKLETEKAGAGIQPYIKRLIRADIAEVTPTGDIEGYTCPNCGEWFDSEIWYMLEPRQHPTHCPYCGIKFADF